MNRIDGIRVENAGGGFAVDDDSVVSRFFRLAAGESRTLEIRTVKSLGR